MNKKYFFNKKFGLVLGVVLLSIFASNFISATNMQKLEVIRVLDGDTIEIRNHKIRLIGIDCYETQNRQRSYKQAYQNNLTTEQVISNGIKSKEKLENLIIKYKNEIYFKPQEENKTDKYNRLLGTVYAGKINVNEYMLEEGGCLKYDYDKRQDISLRCSYSMFLMCFSVFIVFGWYQLEHWSKFEESERKLYKVLSGYCFLNLIFIFPLIYLGFKIMGGWFLLSMILFPFVAQSVLVFVENSLFKGHSSSKSSIFGFIVIPLSIAQIFGGIWWLLYVLMYACYFIKNPILFRKDGE
ncbi:MAG: thermonuclease family protein [Alphaproteobacteria bacterium]|nr:thermonuclease family protein [Alphaproteobacteria bacterium]